MKQKISINELCEGVPEEFKDYLVYVRNLEFKQKPNYKYLYELFTKAFSELNYTWDTYDWERV
jgi:casein kinase 1